MRPPVSKLFGSRSFSASSARVARAIGLLPTQTKELIWRNPERLGDLRYNGHGWIPNSSFYSTDIGPVQLGLECQFLLREVPPLAQASDIDAHLLPDIHAPEQAIV
jgi:hypothetical protein